MDDPEALLKSRGNTRQLAAQITGCAFTERGQAAFGLGDGSVHFTAGADWTAVEAHSGAVLCLVPDVTADCVLTGGDDGKFKRTGPQGATELAGFGSKWVEHAAAFAHPKTPLLACAVGRNVELFDGSGARLRSLAHSSTVTGIAFDAKGKRIAASHYNGASLWFTAAASSAPRFLEWKGSHIGVVLHPQGAALVTAMQENALHGWSLPEGKHLRMSGYPSKTESMSFTRSGRWLATSGAEAVVLWPFFGGGPSGKAPLELADGSGPIVRRVACHPQQEIVAAGFDDGAVVVADIARERILPVAASGRGEVTALTWNISGALLAFGTAEGFAAVVDFSAREA